MRDAGTTPGRITFSVGLFLVVAASGSAAAQRRRPPETRSRVDTTFAFERGGYVNISAIIGNIAVTGWARDQVHVRATSDQDNIRLDASSGRMTLDVIGSRRGDDSRFEVSVPYGVRVSATTRSGDITVHGTRGQVEARANNGNIDVDDVTSRLDVSTFSGDLAASNVAADSHVGTISGSVRLTNVRGGIEVNTVSGDIDLRSVTAKDVRAKTTSGDVTFDGLVDPAGRYEFGTHSGDLRLHIQRDASAQLSVSTWTGGINSQFPITLKPGEHGIGAFSTKRLTFDIGGGAARITAETFSGEITISSNGHGATERR